ncbi:MAG: hypothetical protein MUC77_06870 [Chromatiaceae bacterium]|jgi:hypothetical protein|nr:hypothetical protein [Chromatiaceae bacterium]
MLNQCPSATADRKPIARRLGASPGWERPRFLSEPEAAAYLGVSLASLAELRLRDLELIARGSAPQGPPALWRGMRWSYVTETLDEWRDRKESRRPSAEAGRAPATTAWIYRRPIRWG